MAYPSETSATPPSRPGRLRVPVSILAVVGVVAAVLLWKERGPPSRPEDATTSRSAPSGSAPEGSPRAGRSLTTQVSGEGRRLVRFAPLEINGEDAASEQGPPAGGDRENGLEVTGSATADLGGRPMEVLAGRVRCPNGDPLAAVRVTLQEYGADTGRDGRFLLPRGWGLVSLRHPEYFPRRLDAEDFPLNLADSVASHQDPGILQPVPHGQLQYLDIVLRPGGRVQGTVRDERGRPVENGRVVFGHRESAPEVWTDAQGRYESPLLGPGLLHVGAYHPDFQPSLCRVTIPVAGGVQRRDVELRRGEPMRVRVANQKDEPLADAEVWIRLRTESGSSERPRPGTPRFAPIVQGGSPDPSTTPPGSSSSGAEWRYLGRTGDLGLLETCREPGRSASVRATLAGYQERTAEVRGEDVQVRLSPGPAVRGFAVKAESGLPVKLISLRLLVLSGTEYLEIADRGQLYASLAGGRFVVGLPLQPGTYRVEAEAEGGLFGQSSPFSFDGTTSPPELLIKLDFRMRLFGIVRVPSGPVPGTDVELLYEDPATRGRIEIHGVLVPAPFRVAATTTTDERGLFGFLQLVPGTYRLRAAVAGYAAYLSPPLVVPWDGEYPIILEPGVSLSGVLTGSDGEPEPDMPVILLHGEDTARICWTDGDGRYEFQGLVPGSELRVSVGSPRASPEVPTGDPLPPGAEAPESAKVLSRTVILPEQADCVFNIQKKMSPFGSLRGTIRLAGDPAARIPLRLLRVDEQTGALEVHSTAFSGDEGEFQWRALNPGTYRIEGGVGLAGAAWKDREIEVRAGRRSSVELDLGGVRHRLRFVDPTTGRPPAQPLEVEWVREAGVLPLADDEPWAEGAPVQLRRQTATVSEGVASAEGLLPDRYRLRVRMGAVTVHERWISIEQDMEETIPVYSVEPLTIRLEDSQGTPYRGEARVTVSRDGREIYRGIQSADGSIVAPTTGPGDYELLLKTQSGEARKAFRVAENDLVRETIGTQNK